MRKKEWQVKTLIVNKLNEIEQKEKVKILLAVESGSRAWGFASPDSDYDVRFIYVRPEKEYLKLNSARDVIEEPINDMLDINGWDLQKALKLLYKSNPTLFEWCSSPIIYKETEFAGNLRSVMKNYFSVKRSLYHYISMAEGNYRGYLKGEIVRAKKYFYVLRPLLACRWILDKKTPPPVQFSKLVKEELPLELVKEVDKLLELKMHFPEVKEIPRIDVINKYLEQSITEIKSLIPSIEETENPSWDKLNELFYYLIH